jgi:hypothetical protein
MRISGFRSAPVSRELFGPGAADFSHAETLADVPDHAAEPRGRAVDRR